MRGYDFFFGGGGLLHTLYILMLSMNNISKNNMVLNFMLWIVKNPKHK
jgi:hypothetical protein